MANNEWPYCKGRVEVGEIIENRVNYTIEQWDYVLRRWASLFCYKTETEAEAKADWLVSENERIHATAKYRIVKHTGTKEVIYES